MVTYNAFITHPSSLEIDNLSYRAVDSIGLVMATDKKGKVGARQWFAVDREWLSRFLDMPRFGVDVLKVGQYHYGTRCYGTTYYVISVGEAGIERVEHRTESRVEALLRRDLAREVRKHRREFIGVTERGTEGWVEWREEEL